MFKIFLDIPAQKVLKKLDNNIVLRIVDSIEKLAEDPVPHDSKRVVSKKEKVFRIRVGKFRVLYRVNYEEAIVVVIDVDTRGRAYK